MNELQFHQWDGGVRIRLFGLLLYAWTMEVLRMIGERCNRFILIDRSTDDMWETSYAGILVAADC